MLGLEGISSCTRSGAEFEQLKEKVAEEQAKKLTGKARKRAMEEVDAASEGPPPKQSQAARRSSIAGLHLSTPNWRQPDIVLALDTTTTAKTVDAALAELIYGENIPFNVVRVHTCPVVCTLSLDSNLLVSISTTAK
eukprot:2244339-Pleurochrysis_carterae.AAC.1